MHPQDTPNGESALGYAPSAEVVETITVEALDADGRPLASAQAVQAMPGRTLRNVAVAIQGGPGGILISHHSIPLPPDTSPTAELCREIEGDYWAHKAQGKTECSFRAIAGRLGYSEDYLRHVWKQERERWPPRKST